MAARILSGALPQIDYPILDYVTSLFADADPDDDPVTLFCQPLLESENVSAEEITLLCTTLRALWDAQTGGKEERSPAKLERIVDMRRQEAMSKKSASACPRPLCSSKINVLPSDRGRRYRVDRQGTGHAGEHRQARQGRGQDQGQDGEAQRKELLRGIQAHGRGSTAGVYQGTR